MFACAKARTWSASLGHYLITIYRISVRRLVKLDCSDDSADFTSATWIDLLDPSSMQEERVKKVLSLDPSSRKKTLSIDASDPIHYDRDALSVNARVINRSKEKTVRLVSVTFILCGGKFVTLRHDDPTAFRNFVDRAGRETAKLRSGEAVTVGLWEAVVDRAAEILQIVGDELERLSKKIFTEDGSLSREAQQVDLKAMMQKVGHNSYSASRARESLHSLARIVPSRT